MTRRTWVFWLGGTGLAFLLAALSPWASRSPDGLEKVVQDHGRPQAGANDAGERAKPIPAPLADYKVPGVGNPTMSAILAGLAGTAIALGAALVVGRLVGRRPKTAATHERAP